jgi:hypothetical protein
MKERYKIINDVFLTELNINIKDSVGYIYQIFNGKVKFFIKYLSDETLFNRFYVAAEEEFNKNSIKL